MLVGDHGQLPPVKDKSVYNIQGARSARTGLPLVTAQPFELRGIKRYEEFEDVFFLAINCPVLTSCSLDFARIAIVLNRIGRCP